MCATITAASYPSSSPLFKLSYSYCSLVIQATPKVLARIRRPNLPHPGNRGLFRSVIFSLVVPIYSTRRTTFTQETQSRYVKTSASHEYKKCKQINLMMVRLLLRTFANINSIDSWIHLRLFNSDS